MKKIAFPMLMAILCLSWGWVFRLAILPKLGGTVFAAPAPQDQETSAAYLPVTGPCGLEFPRDHGSHPGYRTEWWYYTGNLRAGTGELFGFQLTFFRRQISPPGASSLWPQPPSPWRTQQVYFAHAAVTDISSKQFHHGEVMARGALGMAGVQQRDSTTTVFVKNWEVALDGKEHRLQAESDDFHFHLFLQAEKEPASHGLSGYSRKGSAPASASCYYSITRLSAGGTMGLKGRQYEVEGLAWMDHEYSSAPLEANLAGWDWFSLQLADRSELMIYQLRQQNGSAHPASSGTYVDRSGRAFHLEAGAFAVEVLDYWTSPHTGSRYPHRWVVTIPSRQLELVVEPQLDDQEMRTTQPTNITYWEGSVGVRGSTEHGAVSGMGYVELTGYAGSLPMF